MEGDLYFLKSLAFLKLGFAALFLCAIVSQNVICVLPVVHEWIKATQQRGNY
jgi:hypothetical protein